MKNIITLLAVLFCLSANAQDYPGKHVELLSGKELKVKPLEEPFIEFGYDDFYTDEAMTKHYAVFQFVKSKYDSLVGKTFKVKDIKHLGKDSFGEDEYRLTIEGAKGTILYFKYNAESDSSFNFSVVGGLNVGLDFYCEQITVTKENGTTHYDAPVLSGIILSKAKKNNVSHIYMTVNENSTTLAQNKKGLTLTLANGKQIARPNAKITVEPGSKASFVYSAIIELTEAEITLLKQSPIVKDKLYIFDGKIDDGKVIQQYIKCLSKK